MITSTRFPELPLPKPPFNHSENGAWADGLLGVRTRRPIDDQPAPNSLGNRMQNVSDAFSGRLLPGERIVWAGVPAQGLLLTPRDAFLLPFSFLWFALAEFWTLMASRSGGALGLFGLIFVGLGVYFAAGRFWLDAWLRGRTFYALTNRRALIIRTGLFSEYTAVVLERRPDIRIIERNNGVGTIRFGRRASIFTDFSIWAPALDGAPQFLNIAQARTAFNLINAEMPVDRVVARSPLTTA
jgi:hypothetical protein